MSDKLIISLIISTALISLVTGAYQLFVLLLVLLVLAPAPVEHKRRLRRLNSPPPKE